MERVQYGVQAGADTNSTNKGGAPDRPFDTPLVESNVQMRGKDATSSLPDFPVEEVSELLGQKDEEAVLVCPKVIAHCGVGSVALSKQHNVWPMFKFFSINIGLPLLLCLIATCVPLATPVAELSPKNAAFFVLWCFASYTQAYSYATMTCVVLGTFRCLFYSWVSTC